MNPPSESRLAARAVALYTDIPPVERKELLAVLGLLDETGQLCDLPEGAGSGPRPINDTREVKVIHHREAPWDRSSVPPGLRDLAPPAREPKSSPQPKKVQRGDCGDKRGTLTGRTRHQKGGTPVCEECRAAYAEWQRDWKASGGIEPCGEDRGTLAGVARHKKWRAKMCADCAAVAKEDFKRRRAERRKVPLTLPMRTETCGSMAGRSNHLRRGEKLCRACKDAQNEYQRARRRQRLAEQEEGAA